MCSLSLSSLLRRTKRSWYNAPAKRDILYSPRRNYQRWQMEQEWSRKLIVLIKIVSVTTWLTQPCQEVWQEMTFCSVHEGNIKDREFNKIDGTGRLCELRWCPDYVVDHTLRRSRESITYERTTWSCELRLCLDHVDEHTLQSSLNLLEWLVLINRANGDYILPSSLNRLLGEL